MICLGCCCHFYFLKDCFSLPLPLSSPTTASPFCLSSAVSLSAFFNNGAMPCACHEVGAESDTCEQFGGQCSCRPNVIGRDCSMCATGYWGFPNCRREWLRCDLLIWPTDDEECFSPLSQFSAKLSIMSLSDEEHGSDDGVDLREIKTFCQYQLVLL